VGSAEQGRRKRDNDRQWALNTRQKHPCNCTETGLHRICSVPLGGEPVEPATNSLVSFTGRQRLTHDYVRLCAYNPAYRFVTRALAESAGTLRFPVFTTGRLVRLHGARVFAGSPRHGCHVLSAPGRARRNSVGNPCHTSSTEQRHDCCIREVLCHRLSFRLSGLGWGCTQTHIVQHFRDTPHTHTHAAVPRS